MQVKLGEQMRAFRLRDGRTQEDLARALGVTSQAVSRWEKGICYPDMEMIPPMANYFGVSIDELFGYNNERAMKIDALASKINGMNMQNNGKDVCIDECINLAREGLAEFPGNERLTLCLASVLYNAGYVKYGEHHLTDSDGYDVFDVERHKTYAEWKEAIKLYEKLLQVLEAGDARYQATRELLQLYVNTGEHEKAAALAESAPQIIDSREMLRAKTCDGRDRAKRFGIALLHMVKECANLMISCIQANSGRIVPETAVQVIKNAIGMYDFVFTDGKYGIFHGDLIKFNLYLSGYLWRAGERDAAFAALDAALDHARALERCFENDDFDFTAPLIVDIGITPAGKPEKDFIKNLPDDWPWWFVPDPTDVQAEMKADPRWAAWVEKTKG